MMSRRPEELYIFVTSPRPDPYINTLVHVTRNYTLRQVHFIGIAEHGYDEEGGEQRAATIMAGTQRMLERLAKGTYDASDGAHRLPDDAATEYRECLNRLAFARTSAMGVRWDDLAAKLREFTRPRNGIFDVTALKKNLLVDVVALLLSLGEWNVRTFEISKKPTFGAEDLIHSLKEGKDYKYRCLADSKHVESARRHMASRSLTLYSLLSVTIIVLGLVIVVQVTTPTSWAQTSLVIAGTTASIASWAFSLGRRRL